MIFHADEIRLNKIYESPLIPGKNIPFDNTCSNTFESCSKINEVYGGFSFPDMPDDRTYTMGSFVQSIDGKIAFPESPDGTLVAKGNDKDPNGALADYWVLNMLRTVCDGVLMGGAMIGREPELTGRIYDPDLSEWRKINGKTRVPLHIIVTGTGSSIPPQHRILTEPDIPVLIVTTCTGIDTLKKKLSSDFRYPDKLDELDITDIEKAVFVCGEEDRIDIEELLKILKKD